jgi:hypothetical protein
MATKKTGPVTLPGKKVSSGNALKHGATSPKLINEEEQDRYEQLLAELEKEYVSSNPLIGLQIARIARITIQLERIQSVIDAAFKKSRMRSNTAGKLMESFTEENKHVEELAARIFDVKSAEEADKARAITFELLNSDDVNKIKSTNDFIKKLPLLSEYLLEKNNNGDMPLKEFLMKEVSNFSESHKQFCDFINEDKEGETENGENKTINSSLKSIDLRLLKLFTTWHAKILKDFLSGPNASISIEESIALEEQAMLPDSSEMDRLMRYQTTLQRQLSAAIGELLILTKSSKSLPL